MQASNFLHMLAILHIPTLLLTLEPAEWSMGFTYVADMLPIVDRSTFVLL